VTVSDGVDSCTGTVAAGTCNVILTTVGTRTLTATYAGDSNFNGSSGTASHTVNPAKAYLPYVARNYPPPTPTPTPTPTLTPTPTPTPTPTLALATVRVNNQTGANLTYQVFYPGSQPKVFPPGQGVYGPFSPGTYDWSVQSRCGSLSGRTNFTAGERQATFTCE
jgi:hypothetical protein